VDGAVEDLFYPDDRIPLVGRGVSGAQSAVWLTGVVTLLAFVTGLSNLSQQVTLAGPLAGVLPGAEAFARFGGVLFAFLLGPVVAGLQRRKRLAWRVALAALPLLALLPLTTLGTTDAPLLAAIAVTLPLLATNRAEFDRPLGLSPLQIASLSSLVGVALYGTVGSYGLRAQFGDLDGWGDAVYYVIVTVATVGYGDITPLTPEAQWFSLSLILLGTGAFTVAVGALIGPAIESRMATVFGTMTGSELSLLEDHVVVLGHGDLTEPLVDELAGDADVVVVTADPETTGLGGVAEVITGDPTDEAVLRDARVGSARGVVVGSDDDARDTLAVLTARNLAPGVRIVAAANRQQNADKLADVGADEVLNPRTIGGRLLGRSVLDPDEPPAPDLFEDVDGRRPTERDPESG